MSNLAFVLGHSLSYLILFITIVVITGYIVRFFSQASRFKFAPIPEKIEESKFFIPIHSRDQKLAAYRYNLKDLEKPAPTVLLLHGYVNEARRDFAYLINALCLQGYLVFGYDQYAHGSSRIKGGPNLKDPDKFKHIYSDLDEVIKYLEQLHDVDANRIAVIGQSMGGTLALARATTHPLVKVVIATAAMNDIQQGIKMMHSAWRWVYKHLLHLYKGANFTDSENDLISPARQLKGKSVNAKVFLAHCKDDTIVRVQQFHANVRLFNLTPDQYILFEKGGHVFTKKETELLSQIISWLNKHL
ncbi:MAG: alpha/beta hydrolase family protein [Candidatus Helarchaeota archaeon]